MIHKTISLFFIMEVLHWLVLVNRHSLPLPIEDEMVKFIFFSGNFNLEPPSFNRVLKVGLILNQIFFAKF